MSDTERATCIRRGNEIKVGQERIAGGLITAIRWSRSGKTLYVTSAEYGTERLGPDTGICMYVDAS